MSYFVVYGIAALAHILIQLVFGHLESIRNRDGKHSLPQPHSRQLVSVIVPMYNEEPDVMRACLESIAAQDHPRTEVIVVDDGSDNQSEHAEVYKDFASLPGWTIMIEPTNRGKRLAQKVGFDIAKGDVIVTIDSDTVLHTPDALRQIQRRFADPKVGAVCGNVGVLNKSRNLLTRLISYRYWMAFHQERAAQSLFGVTMCCSGPFSAYRGDIIARVKERYVSQRFLGSWCTFGDDRHLTNLVLREGERVVFDEHARADTNVPTTMRSYLKQQVRWNKSFYREALWTARHALTRKPYLWFDLALQLMLPFMLITAVGSVVYHAITVSPDHLLTYGGVVLGIAILRSAYGLVRTREAGFLLFSVYGFVHVFLLIPTRLYALTTMRRTHWGSRTPAGAPLPASRARVFQYVTLTALLLMALVASAAYGLRPAEQTSGAAPAPKVSTVIAPTDHTIRVCHPTRTRPHHGSASASKKHARHHAALRCETRSTPGA
jgi:hyaluronan synthase